MNSTGEQFNTTPIPPSRGTEVFAALTLRARLAIPVPISLPVGDEASTYSTIFTPTPAWSEARGESTESPPVNCGGRAGPLCPTPAIPSPWLCPTPWSVGTWEADLGQFPSYKTQMTTNTHGEGEQHVGRQCSRAPLSMTPPLC
ncbi:hypothetical protein E2C01_055828 [Portunus trituberculatus]|uniref:Uncharacterized protein n=1 Tax=Portunus trituberculatus TaxID=210409 RepID=A0A5B7GSB1_PORTR|nr:hypothetical protein [Portunus trituberculatus]